LSLFQGAGRLGFEVSDDKVSVFIQQIAFSLIAKVPEAIESLSQVHVQIFIEAHVTDAEFSAYVLVTIPYGFQIQGHHPATHDGVFMFDPFLLELKNFGFRKLDASHRGPPLLGSIVTKERNLIH